MLLLVSQSGYHLMAVQALEEHFDVDLHLHEVVVGVRGESVPARVQPKRGAARYGEVKRHIGGLLKKSQLLQDSSMFSLGSAHFVEELDVQISKWRDRHCKLFSQSNL